MEYPPILQRWMHSRGFKNQIEFENFANFKLKDLKDPFVLKDMDKACDRLIEAFKKKEKTCLYADFDMDGTPGVALLIKGLKLLGFQNILSFQPNRFDDGYGVHVEIIEDFIKNYGISLFVTVDVGITNIEAVKAAKNLNVDFIITDHHQAKEKLPEAYAIVNPNQPDCTSGLNYLCGTGVAFYLVLALRKKMTEQGLLHSNFDPKKLLDCFAIGTLTDMVPLVNENRVLVQHGLLQLARTERVGIRQLMEKLNLLGKRLSSSDVSIQLAPKLNALGRMNSDVLALDLFLADNLQEADEKVNATMLAQQQRLEIQRQGEVLVEEKLVNKDSSNVIFEWSENFHKGIVGLIATRLTKNYQVPSFIGSLIDNKIVGSGRAPSGISLLEALEYSKDYLVQFGGHHQAAGFELELSNADNFKNKLNEFYANTKAAKIKINYDFKAKLDELNDDFKTWFIKLEPYGVGFKPPHIYMEHLFVSGLKVLKEKHLKLELKDVSGKKIDALWFFADDIEEKKKFKGKRVSVIVEPSINFYMGKESLQIFIQDLKVEY
jgi:single-stranded-DNA-specific exonuclease